MPNWKRVITSGSNAILNNITASGNISGSSTSTGSFGHGYFGEDLEVGFANNTTGNTVTIGGKSGTSQAWAIGTKQTAAAGLLFEEQGGNDFVFFGDNL